MNLPRDEMAFRKAYENLLREKRLTTVFRPSNRLYPNPKGYKIGEVVTARIITTPGNDEAQVAPQFTDEHIPIRITDIKIMKIDEVKEEDFTGSSPDVHDQETLTYHLALIYNTTPENIQEVTRISFSYQ